MVESNNFCWNLDVIMSQSTKTSALQLELPQRLWYFSEIYVFPA